MGVNNYCQRNSFFILTSTTMIVKAKKNHRRRRLVAEAKLLILIVFPEVLFAYQTFIAKHRFFKEPLHLKASRGEEEEGKVSALTGIRLNKVFKASHSRRQADALIASGRVRVNSQTVTTPGGMLVRPYKDIIYLDDQIVKGWEVLNGIAAPSDYENDDIQSSPRSVDDSITIARFEYIKYWKPEGVICTTDRRISGNIIDEIEADGYRPENRVYPVGRLDKDTSGLILLTNDGRLPNASLRLKEKRAKIYNVVVHRPFATQDLDHLRNGVVITTVAQRDRKVKPLTAKTKKCLVRQVNPRGVQMTLYEGRNRQIRKMMSALGYEVLKLHRVSFAGVHISPLNGPGSWQRLEGKELELIRTIVEGN